jgi:hypothetical protein
VPFGTITLEPGTYNVDHIEPPDPSVGIAFGTIVLDLGDGAFAEVDHETLVDMIHEDDQP